MKEELLKLKADIDARLAELAKEKGQSDGAVRADAIQRDELEKMKADIMDQLKAMNESRKEKKMVFGRDAKDGEERIGLGKFLLMSKYNDPRVSKTIMSEGSNAQGGYTVPIEYSNSILGELNDDAELLAYILF